MKWFLLIILIIIIVSMFSYVKLNIVYIFYDGKSRFEVSTTYFFDLINTKIFSQNNTKENKAKKENLFPVEKYSEYKKIIKYVFDKVLIEEIKWRTKIGYEDPFFLSIIYGSIWWIKSLFISFLLSKKTVKKQFNIEIFPHYNINIFETSFNCIIKIRMVYIINIWMKLFKIYKGGDNDVRSSNRGFDENNND